MRFIVASGNCPRHRTSCRCTIDRNIVLVATSPPCSSSAGTARFSSARRSLKRHRRWRPEGRVGSETRTARQPLPRVETAVTDIGASRPPARVEVAPVSKRRPAATFTSLPKYISRVRVAPVGGGRG